MVVVFSKRGCMKWITPLMHVVSEGLSQCCCSVCVFVVLASTTVIALERGPEFLSLATLLGATGSNPGLAGCIAAADTVATTRPVRARAADHGCVRRAHQSEGIKCSRHVSVVGTLVTTGHDSSLYVSLLVEWVVGESGLVQSSMGSSPQYLTFSSRRVWIAFWSELGDAAT